MSDQIEENSMEQELERYQNFIYRYGSKEYSCPELERMRRYCLGAAKRFIDQYKQRGKTYAHDSNRFRKYPGRP